MIGRRRGMPAGMRLPVQRPGGRIQNRSLRVGRMSQFPTVVQVKFVAEAHTLMQMAAIDAYTIKNFRLTPVGTFAVDPFTALGTASTPNTYPAGWITWMNAYKRYKVKAIKVELFPCVRSGDYSKQVVLMLKVLPADNITSSAAFGTPQTWLTDPTVKRSTLDCAGNGIVPLNEPSITEYVKPFDVYRRNQDWSMIEANMTSNPVRYLRAAVGMLRVSGDANTIDWGLRVRCTFYTELFDRNSQMDSSVNPPLDEVLTKALMRNEPIEEGVFPIGDVIVDRKMAV